MATWRELSEDSLQAAETLLQDGRYRSCVSRAYYAAYCAATHEIVQKLTTFSRGWQNPSHELMPSYIQNNLTISRTRKNVVDTDYRPQTTIDELIARDCVRAAAEVQQQLWGNS